MAEYGIQSKSVYEIIDESNARASTGNTGKLQAPSTNKGDIMNSAAKAISSIAASFKSAPVDEINE